MTIHFTYNKKQVIQALRYHFITQKEIKLLLIAVNVFAILSAILVYLKIIQPLSFLIFSGLWLALMLVIWRILPASVYKKAQTFQDGFSMYFGQHDITISNSKGTQAWPYSSFSNFVETPYFFHLYFDNKSFFLIPKDAFENTADEQAVKNLLKAKVVKK